MPAYVAYFRNPEKPARIKAQAITRGFACKSSELRGEIETACGLKRAHGARPGASLIDYECYSSAEAAREIAAAFNQQQKRPFLNHAGKVVFA